MAREDRESLDVARVGASRDWHRAWHPATREGASVGLRVECNLPGESFFIGGPFMPSLRLEVSSSTDLLSVGQPGPSALC